MILNSVFKLFISFVFVIFAVTCGLWHIWWLAILLMIMLVSIWTKHVRLLITLLFLGVITLPITFNKISNRMDHLGTLIRSEGPQSLSTTDRVGIYLGNISMAIVGFAIFAPEVAIETLLLMDPRGQDRTFNSSFAMRSSHISNIIETYTLGVRSGTLPKRSNRIPLKWDEDNRKAYSMDDYRVALAVAGGGLFLNYKKVGKDYESSYWAFACKLDTDYLGWDDFRGEFLKRGGDKYYGAWKLTYEEPLFKQRLFGHRSHLIKVDYDKNLRN